MMMMIRASWKFPPPPPPHHFSTFLMVRPFQLGLEAVGNDEYIILCNTGSRSMSGFKVLAWVAFQVAGSQKKWSVWIGLKIFCC